MHAAPRMRLPTFRSLRKSLPRASRKVAPLQPAHLMILKLTLLVSAPPGVVTTTGPVVAPLTLAKLFLRIPIWLPAWCREPLE